ncbi:hypothetical protein HF1_01890 [Mycoplasma haemofelis str. Langford 1]|nr:hypothetical protein HF1_01890 [Mycoplasma haemofelis str. Langford 1]
MGGIGAGGVGGWGGYKLMNPDRESIHSLITKNGEYYLLSTGDSKDDTTWTSIIGDSNSITQIKNSTGLKEVTNSTLKEWCSKTKDLPSSDDNSLKNYKSLCTKLSTKGKAKADGVKVIDKDDESSWTKKKATYTSETASKANKLTIKVGSGEGTDKAFDNFEAVRTWCGEELGNMFVEANSKTYESFKKWCAQ